MRKHEKPFYHGRKNLLARLAQGSSKEAASISVSRTQDGGMGCSLFLDTCYGLLIGEEANSCHELITDYENRK